MRLKEVLNWSMREGENRETSRMRLETCRIQTQKPWGGAELGVTVIICGGWDEVRNGQTIANTDVPQVQSSLWWQCAQMTMSGAKLCVICNKSIAVLVWESVNYIPRTQEQANCDNRKDKILITPPREREILILADINAIITCLQLPSVSSWHSLLLTSSSL